jgi:magnesium chelatase family protein
MNLSARSIHRIIKLARTLADLDWKENIEQNHILEALQYRSKSMFIEEN